MNLENLSIKELLEIEGGANVLITGGGYWDDGSGQGCIVLPGGFPKFGV